MIKRYLSLSVATLKCLDSKNILIRDACRICVLDALVYSFSSLLRVLLGIMQMNTSSTCSSKIVLQAKASAA